MNNENVFSAANVAFSTRVATDKKGQTVGEPIKSKKKSHAAKVPSRMLVDIVTGQKLVSVYFEPALVPEGVPEAASDQEWLGKNLYLPAAIIKDDTENGLVSVRLPSGDVYKMTSCSATRVADQDDDGVDDILKLKEFSEMSLIHSLRVRYARDEIYTFVGPILISINPYKWLKDMYSEQAMLDYHNKQVSFLDTFCCIIHHHPPLSIHPHPPLTHSPPPS